VCSININNSADETLRCLSLKDREMIVKRLSHFAEEASLENRGALDISPPTRFTGDLKPVKKIRIGRHRVYYTGSHTQCTYNAVHIKKFKKSGVDDEDDKRFQKALIKAMQGPNIVNSIGQISM